MDGSRFDDLTRALATVHTRRGLLGTLLGGLLAVAAAGDAAALGCRAPGRPCNRDDRCCSGLCGQPDMTGRRVCRCVTAEDCPVPCDLGPRCAELSACESGNCRRAGCLIGGVAGDAIYGRGDPNDDNHCQYCNPDRNWQGWTDHDDGTACPPGESDNPCLSTFVGTCQDATCEPEKLADGTECGPDQICCTGECCAAGLPCNAETGCGGCQIEGVNHPAGPKTGNPCLSCDAALNPTGWTPSPGNPPCGDNLDRVCCNGECCPPDQCCSPAGLCEECCETGQGLRDDGTCEPSEPACEIAGERHEAGAPNPANNCEICDPGVDPFAWTLRANNEICGPNGDRACCDGACCSGRGCCGPFGDGQCSVEYCGFTDPCAGIDPCGCTIDGAFYEPYARNPGNDCEECGIGVSTTAWTPVGFGGCGPNGDRFCAGAVCCDLGICPDLSAEVCGDYCDNVCAIGGVLYHGLDRNPANPCQHCAPSADHTAWSYVPPNWYCDPVAQTGACCFEACCGAGSGCNDAGICIVFNS